MLSPPDYSRPFILQTDASGLGIGAVLTQETENVEEHPTERRCSAPEQEGLAVMNACMHFTPYLLGNPFTVVTDHKALSFLALKDPHSHRLSRWMDTLRQFTFSIKCHPGKDNTNADALSHQAWSTHAEEQQMDKNLSKEGVMLGSAHHYNINLD